MQQQVDSISPTDEVPIWEAEDNVEGLARPFAIGLAGYRFILPFNGIAPQLHEAGSCECVHDMCPSGAVPLLFTASRALHAYHTAEMVKADDTWLCGCVATSGQVCRIVKRSNSRSVCHDCLGDTGLDSGRDCSYQ